MWRRALDLISYVALAFWLVAFGGMIARSRRAESFGLRVGIVLGFVVVLGRHGMERRR